MIKQLILLLIVAFRISIQPVTAQIQDPASGTLTMVAGTNPSFKPAAFLTVSGSVHHNKVVLDWTVGENETADKFEVEKSTDGVHFIMAALVFGTDTPSTGTYQFYEKASGTKTLYRIKLINKNKQTAYSSVITIPADNL